MIDAIRKRAKLISSRIPKVAAKTIEKADMHMENMFILPGTGAKPVFAGDPSDRLAG